LTLLDRNFPHAGALHTITLAYAFANCYLDAARSTVYPTSV
jgi:hypothetical protein